MQERDASGQIIDDYEAGSEISDVGDGDGPLFDQRGFVGDAVPVSIDLHHWQGGGQAERTESCMYLVPRVRLDSAPVEGRHLVRMLQAGRPGGTPRQLTPAVVEPYLRFDNGSAVSEGALWPGATFRAIVRVRGSRTSPPATVRWNRIRARAGLDPLTLGAIATENDVVHRTFARAHARIVAVVREGGGRTLRLNGVTRTLLVEGSVGLMRRLCAEPDVRTVAVVTEDDQRYLDDDYTCTGEPTRSLVNIDLDTCQSGGTCDVYTADSVRQTCMFLDAAADIGGVSLYRDYGFWGEAAGGNTSELYLVAGIIDSGFNFLHPAWNDMWGISRILEVHANDLSTATTDWWSPGYVATPTTAGIHGNVTAAIIGADVSLGQDNNLRSYTDQWARTGFAPDVRFRVLESGTSTVLGSVTWTEQLYAMDDSAHPVDVLNMSFSPDGDCTTDSAARGKDERSRIINDLFRSHGVVVLKSAGNERGTACAAELHVGAPCASALISAGVYKNVAPPAAAQSQTELQDSLGATLPDGRSWPSVLTPNQVCGAASSSPLSTGGWTDQQTLTGYSAYGDHGASSAATPKVAGSTLLLKDWYIGKFGDHANQPGRLICNILNMADRYNDSGGGAVQTSLRAQPYWGLGRFRLREWGSEARSIRTAGFFLTAHVTLGSSGVWSYDVSQTTGVVGSQVSRLNALVWWDEPNTGTGQQKPVVYLYLVDDSGTVLDYSNNDNGLGGEQVVSLTFDKAVEPKPCPTGGSALTLYLFVAGDVPADGDDETESYYGETREFYISCTWEVGPDDSLVDCSDGAFPFVRAVFGPGDTCASRVSNND